MAQEEANTPQNTQACAKLFLIPTGRCYNVVLAIVMVYWLVSKVAG
jgi:hypothetical protein